MQTDAKTLKMLSLKQNFPMRPGYGTKGTPVVLWANYVQMTPPKTLLLYRYDISATPAATGRKLTQALNILLGHYSKENGSLAKIGTSKTFSLGQGADRLDLTHGLEAIRGFYTSVRAATGRILVNVNVSNAAFYKAGPLDGLMTAYQFGNKFSLEKFLKKVRVQTTHLKERKNKKGEVVPRIKTIFALAYPSDGQRLEHPPKIAGYGAGPKEVSFWMESQANVVPGQAAKAKLNPAQTQAMIRFAVRKPADNARSIVAQGLQASGLDPETNAILGQFDISLSSALITVPGRVLNPPKITYRKTPAQVRFGSWNMVDIKFDKASKLANWSYLLLSLPHYQDAFDPNSMAHTIKTFGQALMAVGIAVAAPLQGSRAPSIAGMVASIDKSVGQWPATLRIQSEARKEMVSDLEDMLRTRLELWKTKGGHNEYPENILVYRDGVSEGQYQTVLDEELPLLRKACQKAYSPADQKKGLPRFTIIIVGKR
ncbi:hypothetical protein S40288_10405, partial [Stachybotrys chartarum IBT 40288]